MEVRRGGESEGRSEREGRGEKKVIISTSYRVNR